MNPYRVELAPSAARAFKKLPAEVRDRTHRALEELAGDVASEGRVGGKSVKTIRGVRDVFHRLRVSDYRLMYDTIDEDRAILVLGIVHRGDLERWIRMR